MKLLLLLIVSIAFGNSQDFSAEKAEHSVQLVQNWKAQLKKVLNGSEIPQSLMESMIRDGCEMAKSANERAQNGIKWPKMIELGNGKQLEMNDYCDVRKISEIFEDNETNFELAMIKVFKEMGDKIEILKKAENESKISIGRFNGTLVEFFALAKEKSENLDPIAAKLLQLFVIMKNFLQTIVKQIDGEGKLGGENADVTDEAEGHAEGKTKHRGTEITIKNVAEHSRRNVRKVDKKNEIMINNIEFEKNNIETTKTDNIKKTMTKSKTKVSKDDKNKQEAKAKNLEEPILISLETHWVLMPSDLVQLVINLQHLLLDGTKSTTKSAVGDGDEHAVAKQNERRRIKRNLNGQRIRTALTLLFCACLAFAFFLLKALPLSLCLVENMVDLAIFKIFLFLGSLFLMHWITQRQFYRHQSYNISNFMQKLLG